MTTIPIPDIDYEGCGYLIPDDFRTASLQWYTRQLAFDDADVDDPQLTAVICAMSQSFDRLTNDHFLPEDDLEVSVDSIGGIDLYLPKRVRSVDTVMIVDSAGVETEQDPSVYRVISSIDADDQRVQHDLDALSVVPGAYLSGATWLSWPVSSTQKTWPPTTWPQGVGVVKVTGNWNWTAPPDRVRRAVALMVWDVLKPFGDIARRASSFNTADANYQINDGMPEVIDIVNEFRRNPFPVRVG